MSKLTLSFKGQILKFFPIRHGTMIVGNDPACDIHIDSLALEPQHLQIDTKQQSSRIRALSQENDTLVNNKKIDTHVLKDGDIIQVGKHTLSYTFEEIPEEEMLQAINNADEHTVPDIPAPSVAEPAPEELKTEKEAAPARKLDGWLQIMSGQNLGKTLSLHRSMTNLGKPGLATAVISHRENGYFISQLEGKHPIQVNSQPTVQPTKLNPDDIIQIGNIKMQFYLE